MSKTFGQVLPGVTYVDRPGAYGFLLNDLGELAIIRTSMGLFLPGGGLDPGEDELTALARELREEICFELTRADFVLSASQYHWSAFYKQHFKKIGSFYRVEAHALPGGDCADGHELVWIPVDRARVELSQEFQRWAVEQAC